MRDYRNTQEGTLRDIQRDGSREHQIGFQGSSWLFILGLCTALLGLQS